LRKNEFAVDSRDVKLHWLYNNVMADPSTENHKALQDEINHRMKVDKIFEEAFPKHIEAVRKATTPLPTEFECYRKLITAYEEKCMEVSDYTLKYFKAFVAECEGLKSFPEAVDQSVERLAGVCQNN